MTTNLDPRATAIADVGAGTILARVEIAAPIERVFRALTTSELAAWWGADDLYRTTAHAIDLRPGGRWRSDGVGADGHTFHVGGEVLEVDPPHTLVQTWVPSWVPAGTAATTVAYALEAIDGGTRVTVRHSGFVDPASCRDHSTGWIRVLGWLTAHAAPAAARKAYLCRLLPPRASFMSDMTADERAVMGAHAVYWRGLLAAGSVVAFGPVADPAGGWGLCIVEVTDDEALRALLAADPAITAARGFRYDTTPMISVVSAR